MFGKRKKPTQTNLARHYLQKQGMNLHLYVIHLARLHLVTKHLPKADVIIDLGGANSPLYQLGYPYSFRKMTMVDLPPDERDDQYKDIVTPSDVADDGGVIAIQYGSMIDLDDFKDESVDLVWSGQSIEHISREDGEKMCRNVYRILRKGGSFCLDTPNRYLTELHTKEAGDGFINPDHKFEYYSDDLENLLKASGFRIYEKLGLCHMPNSETEFMYGDFIVGDLITKDVRHSYVQYFHCKK